MTESIQSEWDAEYFKKHGKLPRVGQGDGGGSGMDLIRYRLDQLDNRADKTDAKLGKLADMMIEMSADVKALHNASGRIEARLDKIDDRRERDFRLAIGAIVTVTLGLAGLMAHGFKWL